jgi:hypothetical protein
MPNRKPLWSYLLGAGLVIGASNAFATSQNNSSTAMDNTISGVSELFPGRSQVSISEVLQALAQHADVMAKSPAVRHDYQQFLIRHALKDNDMLYSDFVRIRLAFETTRAGGLWGIAWNITDQLPQSDRIWAQWQTQTAMPKEMTAVAECDELSALFAYVARRIGLSKQSQVGLLWPTSNHTVAVWIINGQKNVRVVVPTSQIFLDETQSLDTLSFDPWKQKNIYDYRREDIALTARIPASLARYFIIQTQQYSGLSQTELQTMRNRRESRQRGSK